MWILSTNKHKQPLISPQKLNTRLGSIFAGAYKKACITAWHFRLISGMNILQNIWKASHKFVWKVSKIQCINVSEFSLKAMKLSNTHEFFGTNYIFSSKFEMQEFQQELARITYTLGTLVRGIGFCSQ